MQKEEIAPHVKDITRALGNKVSEEEIEAELMDAVENFGMALGQAKRTVMKNHGGNITDLRVFVKKGLSDLETSDVEVELVGRVIYVAEREITSRKSGSTKKIISGILGDGTVSRPFTIWKTSDINIKKGDVIRIKRAYITEWKGEPQINIDDNTEIEHLEGGEIPATMQSYSVPDPVEKKLEEVEGTERNLKIKGKILSVNSRRRNIDGREKEFFYGLIGDDTKTLPFTAWKDFGLEKGDVISIEGAYARLWKDSPQINMSENATVKRLEEDMETIPYDGGPAVNSTIRDIGANGSRVNITGRIIGLEEREFNTERGRTRVKGGVIADETGKINFTSWIDFPYDIDDVVSISGARVRYWRGLPQLNIEEGSNIQKVDIELPSRNELDQPAKADIYTLIKGKGAIDAAVSGVIMDIKSGSGLIFRCPECRKVLQNGSCSTHGVVEGSPDLRIKAVLDDGTGTVNIVIGTALTEEILGMDLDATVKLATEKMNFTVIQKEVEDRLLARHVLIRGDVTCDDFGLNCYVTEISFLKTEVQEEARKLLEEVEI